MQFHVRAHFVQTGWEITVHEGNLTNPPLLPPRLVPMHGAKAGAIPLVPPNELQSAVPVAPSLLQQMRTRIATKQLQTNDIVQFGSHLFAVLFGDAVWTEILARAEAAKESSIDIALVLDANDHTFARLPWEMMCKRPAEGNAEFLAVLTNPRISFHRVVQSKADLAASQLVTPLRVLFVVGAALDDPEVEAGAEYLGLLRHLQAQGLQFDSHVLLEASLERVGEAYARLRPAIVHFIGHGGISDTGGFVTLRRTGQPAENSDHEALSIVTELRSRLNAGDSLPAVIVLNICRSAEGSGVAPTQSSLAADLVDRGIPLVVGMGGRVADRACRLFTRQFYESLLRGHSIERATADARRAGLSKGGNPTDNVDWAIPTLFVNDKMKLPIPIASNAQAAQVSNLVATLGKRGNLGFCDRLDAFETYQRYLANLSMPAAPTVLAVEVTPQSVAEINVAKTEQQSIKLGVSWLLRQMVARAPYDRLLPTMLPPDSFPKSPMDAALRLLNEANDIREDCGLERIGGLQVWRIRDNTADENLDPQVRAAREEFGNSDPVRVLAVALRKDLLRIAKEDLDFKPLVLVDQAHKWGDVLELMIHLVRRGAAVTGRFPVILGYDLRTEASEFFAGRTRLREFLEQRGGDVELIKLGAFSASAKHLAYRQHLLLQQPPQVFVSKDDKNLVQGLLDQFHLRVGGVPSRFSDPFAQFVVETGKMQKLIVDADDRVLLQEIAKQGGFGA